MSEQRPLSVPLLLSEPKVSFEAAKKVEAAGDRGQSGCACQLVPIGG